MAQCKALGELKSVKGIKVLVADLDGNKHSAKIVDRCEDTYLIKVGNDCHTVPGWCLERVA